MNTELLMDKIADRKSQLMKAQEIALQKRLQTLTKKKQTDHISLEIPLLKIGIVGILVSKLHFGQFEEYQCKKC